MSADPILITGASSDLALDLIHRLLATAERRIVCQYHSSGDRIEALRAKYGASIVPFACDLTAAAEAERLVAFVRESIGTPSKLVHFPAMRLQLERFSKWDSTRFENDLRLQVGALAAILRALLPEMSRQPSRSKVVFVLSTVTRGAPPKFMSMYTVVKYAQLGLMRALAAEYSGKSININGVSPSMVETRFLSELPGKAVELAAAHSATGRHLAVGEVTDVIDYLLSAKSDHLMGVDLPVTDTFIG